ncbi:prepilin-type N-terminal cleavage/methylation domain-containing protein [Bdellovibrionota bacterium FG-2]
MKTDKGFSLIELMMVVALMSVVGLAIANIAIDMQKASSSVAASSDWNTLVNQIELRLREPGGCSDLLQKTSVKTAGWKPDPNSGSPTLDIGTSLGLVLHGNVPLLKNGITYGNSLTVSDIHIGWDSSTKLSDSSYFVTLFVSAQKKATASLGGQTLTKVFGLTVFSSSTDNTCNAAQQSSLPFVVIADDPTASCHAGNGVQLKACLEALSSGQTAFIKSGSYNGVEGVNIPSGVRVMGEQGTVLSNPNQTPCNTLDTPPLFNLSGDNVIENITFDLGDNPCSFSTAIKLLGSNVQVLHSRFLNGGGAAVTHFGIRSDSNIKNIQIMENSFGEDASAFKVTLLGSAMLFSGVSGRVVIKDNRMILTPFAATVGISVDLGASDSTYSSHLEISRNHISNSSNAIYVSGDVPSGTPAPQVSIRENYILAAGPTGAMGIDYTSTNSRGKIQGNFVTCNAVTNKTGTGIDTTGIGASGNAPDIIQNTIVNCQNAIKASGKYPLISENTIDYENAAANLVTGTIGIKSSVCGIVSNNQIKRAQMGASLSCANNQLGIFTGNYVANIAQANGVTQTMNAAASVGATACSTGVSETVAVCVKSPMYPMIVDQNIIAGTYTKRIFVAGTGGAAGVIRSRFNPGASGGYTQEQASPNVFSSVSDVP